MVSVLAEMLSSVLKKSLSLCEGTSWNTGLLVRTEEVSVYEVTEGGLGEAILQAGDVVKSITIGENTITITRQHHLIDAMLDVRVGDTVSLVIVRDGAEMTVSTTITEDSLSAY